MEIIVKNDIVNTETTLSNNSDYLVKEKSYFFWSLVNLFCGCFGFIGLFCTIPALIFSFKIKNEVIMDRSDVETIEKYSTYSRRLNLCASLTYIIFFIFLLSLFIIIITDLRLLVE